MRTVKLAYPGMIGLSVEVESLRFRASGMADWNSAALGCMAAMRMVEVWTSLRASLSRDLGDGGRRRREKGGAPGLEDLILVIWKRDLRLRTLVDSGGVRIKSALRELGS